VIDVSVRMWYENVTISSLVPASCTHLIPQVFISNFYADNAAFVLRADRIMYGIFAYLAIFRLEELGFQKFKEFTMTQDPTKINTFASYLFNRVSTS
jgi:hypothetical protein